jgi:hypothetical protein
MCQDRPEDSDEYSYELLDGDIIVSATDGVFDNLFSHEILQIVRTFKQKQKRLCTKEQADVSFTRLIMCRNWLNL